LTDIADYALNYQVINQDARKTAWLEAIHVREVMDLWVV
jgi:hypothetical protein